MDIAIPANYDIDVDGSDEELEPFHWGEEIAKSLTLSAVQTAGLGLGFVAVAIAFDQGTKLYNRFRKPKSELATVHNITDLPKTAEN